VFTSGHRHENFSYDYLWVMRLDSWTIHCQKTFLSLFP